MLEVATNPKRLGAHIGFINISAYLGQNLLLYPHVHCMVPGGRSLERLQRLGPSQVGILLARSRRSIRSHLPPEHCEPNRPKSRQ
jgi:hypothetical protein